MITSAEFAARRQKLMATLGAGTITIIPAAPELIRNGDAHYRYRPCSDFYYLTGFKEPEAVAVLIPGRSNGEFVLFVRPRDPSLEQWTGPRAGLTGACDDFGADTAFSIADLDEEMPKLLQDRAQVHYPLGRDPAFDERMRLWLQAVRSMRRSGVNAPDDFMNIEHTLHEMRLFKSEAEIALMREAAEISAHAHKYAMEIAKPGMKEYELSAAVEYDCRRKGCEAQAYESIAGGGANACVLHYIANQDELRDGDLVLIDAGGEYQYYAADITRTFPVNGKFSPAQKNIYELVLRAQLAAIAMIRPGVAWNEPQEVITRILTEGLLSLGLLQGDIEELLEKKAYRRFYMHNYGHWLGLDVHDVGVYKQQGEWRALCPGMVLTVEPGLYIAASDDISSEWWNIGIRIEDDVLVTVDGCDVLSKSAPKTISELESAYAKKL